VANATRFVAPGPTESPSPAGCTSLGSTQIATAAFARTGTTTNDNAVAGQVGEFITATVASGSAVALTRATPANVTGISLTSGDWDVRGTIAYMPAGTTSVTNMLGGINTTSATSGADFANYQAALVPGAVNPSYATGTVRLSLSATTTVYLVAQAAFTVAAMSAFGFIGARRAR
jgi:hypothetical protein